MESAWQKLIIKSFKPCPLTFTHNGSEGNIIHYFKSGQSFSKRAVLLKDQVNQLRNDIVANYNPFAVKDWDVDEANTETNIINERDNKDDFKGKK